MLVSNGLGKERVTVPDIIGLKLTKAKQKVRKSGLRVGEIRYKSVQGVAPNTVLNYYPKVKKAVVGSIIKFVVSGLPKSERPDTLINNRLFPAPDTINSKPLNFQE